MRRLVLFDLDDTLIDHTAALNEWAGEFVITWGLEEKWATFLVFGEAHRSVPWVDFFEDVRREFELPETAEQLWKQYRVRMAELARCREGALDGLLRLRDADWRIGIVTNGMRDSQLGKIHHAGLAPLIDGWCISEEAGVSKPDPAMFRLAAQRCGHPAGATGWVVGVDLSLDIAGGQAAGMRTIWLRSSIPSSTVGEENADFVADNIIHAVDRILVSAD